MKYLRWIMLCLVVAGLIASFWFSQGWLQLCAGLAVFLFGMQCLEEGLRQLAGSKLEQILARSTSTSFKSLLFGVGGTLLLQSSTLVSLLTIAFISTGLIQLAGGIAILFGANLGATSGIWLLALAGQNFFILYGIAGASLFRLMPGTGPRLLAAVAVVLVVVLCFWQGSNLIYPALLSLTAILAPRWPSKSTAQASSPP